MQAAYMVLAQGGCAGVEHFRRMFSYLDCSIDMTDKKLFDGHRYRYYKFGEVCEGPRPRNLHLGGTPIAMTLRMVGAVIPNDDKLWHIVKISPNSMEYELAGFLLLMTTLSTRIKELMFEFGWFCVPLDLWCKVVKPKMDLIRRAGMFGELKDDSVYNMRKLISVTIRRDDEADWEKEKFNRTNVSWGKVCMSGAHYLEELMKEAELFETLVVNGIAKRGDSESVEGWYGRRHHFMPSGSTSCGSWIRPLMRKDGRLGSNDRPNKKSVFEALDVDCFNFALGMAPIWVARGSTKPEPGDKPRAVYANNELSYILNSYGSVHAEKEMGHFGSVARQGIDDFAVWVQENEKPGYWLSADLTDYNANHELYELSLMNTARAKCWLRTTTTYRGSKSQVHMWIAEAVLSSWIQFPGDDRRVISGMFSGSRDTMRDNTTKHTCDLRIILKECSKIGMPVMVDANFQAGDDEDTKFRHCLDAAVYLNVMGSMNHQLNAKKQLAGVSHHEFLQVMVDSFLKLQRPLGSLIATMASGNWYVPTATWFSAAISGISDNWWEAAVRGLDLHAARHMAAAYLDTIMRIKPEGGKYVALEWWDYRSPRVAHPLWDVVTKAPPEINEKPTSRESWPHKATDDWLKAQSRILQHATESKYKMYREFLLQESHGSAFLEWRQENLRTKVLEIWPERKVRMYPNGVSAMEPGFTSSEMAFYYSQLGTSTLPRDEKELASRLGVDPQLVSLVGGWNRLGALISGPNWAKFSATLEGRQLSKRTWASSWAFRSWASRTTQYVEELHSGGFVPRKAKRMLYIVANNGAGKSYLMNKNTDWVEMDTFASSISFDRPHWINDSFSLVYKEYYTTKVLERLISGGARIFMGQWHPDIVVKCSAKLGVQVDWVHFEPGEDIRISRLIKRGYDMDRIESLKRRWFYSNSPINDVSSLQEFVAEFIVNK